MSGARPAVSVIVPFLGIAEEAAAVLEALASLRLQSGDEVIVADNTGGDVVAAAAARFKEMPLRVVAARQERSSYYARNVAAEQARNEWLWFTDADCLPSPTLVDELFDPPPEEVTGAIAGRIVPAPGQRSTMARWAASREVLNQAASLTLPGGPAGATANLLVRRRAWAAVGGFLEGVPSGGDYELCWRIQDAGWKLEYRAGAVVEHLHRETFRSVLRQFATYAAAGAWLNRRRAGAVPRPRLLRPLARAMVGIPGFALTGRLDRARMKAVDAAVVVAQGFGYLRGNALRAAVRSADDDGLLMATDHFPVLTEQFATRETAALIAAGRPVRIEAIARPARPLEGGSRGLAVNWLEDEGTLQRAGSLARLIARHPLRCAADLWRRRRFAAGERMPLRALAPAAVRLMRGGERHVHVHFAALAAVNALRIGRIVGVPVSLAPHAHEVYRRPRAVPAKLAQAAFVTTECAYNVKRLRAMAPAEARERIEAIPFGIDAARTRRSTPPPGGRNVLAVGRLVAQKGFPHLIEAAAVLERDDPLDRLVIAGGGPLRADLERLANELGVAERTALVGPLEADAIRELMERSDLFVMPSVIAPDGARDALPVVVLEALAMELPVIASDEVGLPEVVRPEWGRLVPPGDAAGLARAIAELLALSPARRAAMGAAGRAHVIEHHDLHRQTAKLVSLIDRARRAGSQSIGTR